MQCRQRGVQHLARFQSGQSRRVDPHALGHLGQCQSLAFPDGFEPRQQPQNRRETLLIDGTGRPLADRFCRVLPANGFFLGPLLGGAFGLIVGFMVSLSRFGDVLAGFERMTSRSTAVPYLKLWWGSVCLVCIGGEEVAEWRHKMAGSGRKSRGVSVGPSRETQAANVLAYGSRLTVCFHTPMTL